MTPNLLRSWLSVTTDLGVLGGWLGVELGCPVERRLGEPGLGLISVELERASGPIMLTRHGEQAILSQPGQPDRQMALQRPDAVASLAEELRRLADDGAAVILVTHDLGAAALAESVLIMRDGRIEMAEKGFYDKKGLKIIKRIRCDVAPAAPDCSQPTESWQ